MSSRHIGEPLWSRSPHPTRRAAVRALCGRAVRAYDPALNDYQQTLEYVEVEGVVRLTGLCRNCVTSFKVSVHYDGETRRRLEGEMHP